MLERAILESDVESAIATLRVMNGLLCDFPQVIICQLLKLEYPRARDKSGVDFKIWILCSGPYKYECAILDPRQKRVLLAFIPTMHLIYEKDCAYAIHLFPSLGFIDFSPELLYARKDRIKSGEMALCRIRYHSGKRRLSRSGWAIENNR